MCARYGRTRGAFPKIRLVHLFALAATVVVAVLLIALLGDKSNSAYHPPDPPDAPDSSSTTAYALVTGTLRGVGILTLDGSKAFFEPIGKSSMNDIQAEYKSPAPRGERVVTLGGDFAGESGLIEYPTRDSNGSIRVFLRGGLEPVPMAVSVVLSEGEPSKSDLVRLDKLINHYKAEALLERAAAAVENKDGVSAEGFARQAIQASADVRRSNYLLARALILQDRNNEVLPLLTSAADSGTLNASGYDLWFKLLDKENKSSEGLSTLDKVIKSGKLDNLTLLVIRGSVYHRRLVGSSLYAEAKFNLEKYIELADIEEAGNQQPMSQTEAKALVKHIEGILAGKPTQLLEERFEKTPCKDFGEIIGNWKLTQAKGESFFTATPSDKASSELFLDSLLGFTKDIRISLRFRLREPNSRLDLYPEWDGNSAYHLAITNTWSRLFYASPPRQSDLQAKLLAESRFDSPIEGVWISISVTERGGALSVSFDGKEIIKVKDKEYVKIGNPVIITSGGVVDIDDIVVTSF